VLLGEPGVGKTSLIRRFVLNSFDDKYIATIGVKVSKKSVEMEYIGKISQVNMMIYDILGQHDFKKVRRTYLKGAEGAIFVGDLSDVESAKALESFWIPEMEEAIGSVPAIILGNKLDLGEKESETASLLKIISSIASTPFAFCSAKTGEGVEIGFAEMASALLQEHEFDEDEEIEKGDENMALRMAADAIMDHFCEEHGDPVKSMEICSSIFEKIGFSLESPDKERLLKVIEMLATEEESFLDRERIERNREERLNIIEKI